MDEQSVIEYWLKTAKQDFETAEILYKNKKYHHALFFDKTCFAGVAELVDAVDLKSNPVYFCGFNSATIKCVSYGDSGTYKNKHIIPYIQL